MDVVGGSLGANQNGALACQAPLLRRIRVESGYTRCLAGGSVQTLGQETVFSARFLNGVEVKTREQQLVDLNRLDTHEGLFLSDQSLVDHIDCCFHGGGGGSLASACLKHPQFTPLDGELHVLDITVMLLKHLGHCRELLEDFRHVCSELGDLLGGSDTGYNVFTLGVLEILAVENLLTGSRVTSEGNTGTGVTAHVPKHHRLDVHSRAPVVRQLVEVTVVDGALTHPRIENGRGGQSQLFVGIGREINPLFFLDDSLKLLDNLLQHLLGQIGILTTLGLGLVFFQYLVKWIWFSLDVQHNAGKHLNETAIGVQREAAISGELGQTFQRFIVEAQVEHRVHHAGHRSPRAGTYGDEERILRVSESLPCLLLYFFHGLENLFPHSLRELLAQVVVLITGFGCDREAWWDRQAGVNHLGQVRAFATQEIAHVFVAFAEKINPLF